MKKVYKGTRKGNSFHWNEPVTFSTGDDVKLNFDTGDVTVTLNDNPGKRIDWKFRVLNWKVLRWHQKIYWRTRLGCRDLLWELKKIYTSLRYYVDSYED